MVFPKPSFSQGILWFIAILGFFLILLSFWWLAHPGEKKEPFKDRYGHERHGYRTRRPHIHMGFAATGLALLLIGGVLLGIAGAVQEYLGLTGKILVAHVRATKVTNPSNNLPMMSVDLISYDQNGNQASENTYIVNGDEVFIGGDIIAFQSWMNILGFHSGYKLTKLEGMYSDVNLERNSPHTVEVLNGGDDSFFNDAYHKGLSNWVVTAAYKNGSSVPTNNVGYNICVSQDAIVPQPDNQPC